MKFAWSDDEACFEFRCFGQKRANYSSRRLLIMKKEETIYGTIIILIVIYDSEVWALSRSDENTLKMWESKILRKIFWPL